MDIKKEGNDTEEKEGHYTDEKESNDNLKKEDNEMVNKEGNNTEKEGDDIEEKEENNTEEEEGNDTVGKDGNDNMEKAIKSKALVKPQKMLNIGENDTGHRIEVFTLNRGMTKYQCTLNIDNLNSNSQTQFP